MTVFVIQINQNSSTSIHNSYYTKYDHALRAARSLAQYNAQHLKVELHTNSTPIVSGEGDTINIVAGEDILRSYTVLELYNSASEFQVDTIV